MEFVICFAMLQSLRARRKFTAHADSVVKGRGAVALLSMWYSSRTEMFWGSSGQHAAAQQSECWVVRPDGEKFLFTRADSFSCRAHGYWFKVYRRTYCGGSKLGLWIR